MKKMILVVSLISSSMAFAISDESLAAKCAKVGFSKVECKDRDSIQVLVQYANGKCF